MTMDREQVLAVLRRRFRGASAEQLAEAANAIMALADSRDGPLVRSVTGLAAPSGRIFAARPSGRDAPAGPPKPPLGRQP